MRSGVLAVLLVALLATGLTSCTSSTESYCASLKDDKKQLTGQAAQGDLHRTVTLLAGLRDEAPDDISGEWDTLVTAIQDLVDAVDATGAKLSQFQGGRKPAGVTTGQYRAVQQAAGELSSTRVQQAGQSIEQHALDVCKVDLGGGLGGTRGG
ncbi:MAG: hypothetical protein HOQ22_08775 [Nocardioidaceae bacterium]|nr:hypothetical protein [Nocardioidaceae bacterium]NUS51114.1 hypothetical protein [Nocardioidaceae bacterium]